MPEQLFEYVYRYQNARRQTSRYIAGFSCESGTVESKDALKELNAKRRDLKSRFPNLVDYESKLAFRNFHKPELVPEEGTVIDDIEVRKTLLGGRKRTPIRRAINRSGSEADERRSKIRIGILRVLNIYSTAPLWRTYFEALGMKPAQIVFSDYTSEEMWAEGGRYGSIDPCYPSKVTQAHIHNLIFKKSAANQLDYIFFPCLTHMPTFVNGVEDSTSCPIVYGAPKVIRAAFTKETDFFAKNNIEYVDAAFTLTERNYFAKTMLETWGERLGITED